MQTDGLQDVTDQGQGQHQEVQNGTDDQAENGTDKAPVLVHAPAQVGDQAGGGEHVGETSVGRAGAAHCTGGHEGQPVVVGQPGQGVGEGGVGGAAVEGDLDGWAELMADPVAAQIKGHDGDTWVLACVLFDVKAVVTSTSTVLKDLHTVEADLLGKLDWDASFDYKAERSRRK